MNLIKADLYRIVRDKALYVLLAALAALSLLVGTVYHLRSFGADMNAGDIVLKCIGTDTLCTVLGIATALFLGRDYEQNTIRGKLCRGEPRMKVYLCKLAEGYMLSAVFFLAATLAGLVSGFLWFGHAFGPDFMKIWLCELAVVLAFSSMITTLCVCTGSVRIPLITTVILFVVMNPLALMLPGMEQTPAVTVLCRTLYPVVSSMLLSSSGGVYRTVSAAVKDGQSVRTVTEFTSMFLNAVLLAAVYTAVSVIISLAVVRKQEYK